MRAATLLPLALLAVFWLARPVWAVNFTEEICFSAGVKQCRDAEGGAAARTACLRAYLAGCSYHCPTMDADCALKQMESAAVEYWRDEMFLWAVPDACRVMAQCSPPPPLPLIPEP